MVIYIIMILFVALPTLLVIVKSMLQDLYLWQKKEYRLDRMLVHLRFKEERGKRNTNVTLFKLILLLCSIFILVFPKFTNFSLLTFGIAFTFYLFEVERSLVALLKDRVERASLRSVRNMLVLALSLLTMLLPFLLLLSWIGSLPLNETAKSFGGLDLPLLETTSGVGFSEILATINSDILVIPLTTLLLNLLLLVILILDLATSLIISFWVVLTEPVALIKRGITIRKARQKLKNYPHLKVVAITGSYGKTTVKELTTQLLSAKFKTVKTPKNYNTAVGIAQTILDHLKPGTEILVAEIGAYKRGEINDALKLIHPDISVVSGIAGQHLALFGNFENLLKAKYEIVEGLKSDGVAIFNADNEHCLQMAEWTDKHKFYYYTFTQPAVKENDQNFISATNMRVMQNKIRFTLNYQSKQYELEIELQGKHNLQNLLAAMSICLQLGFEPKELVEFVQQIKFELPYLRQLETADGVLVIDDGYNSSVQGFASALEYISDLKVAGKKWVFTQGIIELGDEKKHEYKNLAKKITKICDGIATNDKELAAAISDEKSGIQVKLIQESDEFVNTFQSKLQRGDLMLIEGTFQPKFLNLVMSRHA